MIDQNYCLRDRVPHVTQTSPPSDLARLLISILIKTRYENGLCYQVVGETFASIRRFDLNRVGTQHVYTVRCHRQTHFHYMSIF